MSNEPLLNKRLFLERFEGKGGWTFARIPGLKKNKKTSSGPFRVKGTIDGFQIKRYHLMPMGDGNLFLPVRAEIRKKIKKQAGDAVHIILYQDTDPLEIPEEMLLCISDEPEALHFFNGLSDSEKKYYIQWIYSAKREETKIYRLGKTIERLLRNLKMYDKEIPSY